LRSGTEHAQHHEDVASLVEDDTWSLSEDGPVISVSSVTGAVRKVSPSPMASKLTRPCRAALAARAELGRIEIELGPLACA
jgi:hypothetical protein